MNIDPLAQFYSSYVYCGNDPVKYIDLNGMYAYDWNTGDYENNNGDVVSWSEVQSNNYTESNTPPDIVINGSNNSSLTLKTDAVDLSLTSSIDFGGNHEIADVSSIALGKEYSGSATGAAAVGTSYSISYSSVLFLGGDYSGYWYDYIAGEAKGVGTLSAEASLEGGISYFVAINKKRSTLTPEGFAGNYYTGGVSLDFKVLGGVTLNGQYSRSEDNTWKVYSLGASVSVGPQVGFVGGFSGSINGGVGSSRLITPQKRTQNRSTFDMIFNWLSH